MPNPQTPMSAEELATALAHCTPARTPTPKPPAQLSPEALTLALQPWVDARKDDVTILGTTLGTALANLPNSYGLQTMDLHELLSAYVATIVGKRIPGILKLHAKLVELAGVESVYNFGYADRYAMVYADTPTFKTMAFQTQNYTYLVALRSDVVYCRTGEDYVRVPTWRLHLRLCTAGPRSLDYARPALDSPALLDMLKTPEALSASEYFRYKDGRDRGYLCSLRPDPLDQVSSEVVFETKDMHWYAALSYLTGVMGDLESHVSMVDEMESPQ